MFPSHLQLRGGPRLAGIEVLAVTRDGARVTTDGGEREVQLAELYGGERRRAVTFVRAAAYMVEVAQQRPAVFPIRIRAVTARFAVQSGGVPDARVYVLTPAMAERLTGTGQVEVLAGATTDANGVVRLRLPAGVPFVLLAQAGPPDRPPLLEWQVPVGEETTAAESGPHRPARAHRFTPSLVGLTAASNRELNPLQGQAGSDPGKSGGGTSLDHRRPEVVTVFYATDRKYESRLLRRGAFGGQRGELSFGTCEISIPPDHRIGELETKGWLTAPWTDEADTFVVLRALQRVDGPDFFRHLKRRIAEAPAKNALVFVHGYNVTFEDAARRTGQMAYDLSFQGAPLFYSWPSEGRVAGYPTDEANIEWSETNLRAFLRRFVETTEAESVSIIAHSMGNRAVTRVLATLFTEMPAARRLIKAVILAAPDIDADVFRRDLAPRLAGGGSNLADEPIVTLYVSATDRALAASKKFHTYPRIGDCSGGVPVLQGFDTIDATAVETDLFGLGHSYVSSSRTVLADIYHLVTEGARAERRFGLRAADAADGRYWVIKP